MMNRKAGVSVASSLLAVLLATGCTGGKETKAADEGTPGREAPAAQQPVDAVQTLATINPAIPLYQGAQYREDLTRRDEVMIRSRYGADAKVYTLATDDSFPQVYHYYTTYLAQFRSFPAQDTYPPEQKSWRTLEVQLNQAMQDPFIPGEALDPQGQQITLQVAETEAEPRTVIRYIVTSRPAPGAAPAAPVATVATASVPPAAAQPVTR
jgi:hypothetical protein